MVVPAHGLITFSGVFGSAIAPIEEWQFSLKTTANPLFVDGAYDDLSEALATVYVQRIMPRMPDSVVCTEVEFAYVSAGGLWDKTEDGRFRRGRTTFTGTGSATGGPVYPLQTALTVSLTTGRDGPSGKGRFYLPMPGVALGADGRLPEAYMAPMATAMAGFISDVNLVVPQVSVVSSKGFSSPVTGVRVGRVPDTQRRRRGDMIESYAAAAVA